MKKNNNWLYIFILICISTFLVTKTLQNDTFYSIKIGDYILNNGIDMKDHFSAIQNLPYTYPHWLFDIMVSFSYSLGGLNGLYILTILLAIILGISLFILLNKLFKENLLAFFLTFLIMLLMMPFIALRAQLLTYICFVLLIYNLIKFLENKNIKNAITILLLSIVVANAHAAVWPFILVLFLPYFAEYLMCLINNKIKLSRFFKKIEIRKEKNIKNLFYLFLIVLVTGLITPTHFTPYTYTIKTMLGTSMNLIGEHSTSTLESPLYLFVIIIPLGIFLLFGKKKRLADFFMLLGLLILAIMSRRHIALLLIIGIFYIFNYFFRFINKYKIEYEWIKSLPKYILVKIVLLLIFTIPYIPLFITNLKSNSIDEKEYPVKATEFILKHYDIDKINVFNDYNYGAYLLYRGLPPHIDSRCDLYTYPFNKTFDYFNKYIDFDRNYYQNYYEYFKDYNINTIILKHNSYLVLYLYKDYRFYPAYLDEAFVVFRLTDKSIY